MSEYEFNYKVLEKLDAQIKYFKKIAEELEKLNEELKWKN